MQILLLNPNTSANLTARMEETARTALPAGAGLDTVTAPRGFSYISTRPEALVAGAIALEMLAATPAAPDAAIIAAFGDPGTRAARELFPFPVIGVAEAAMHSAAMLGDRFAIVGFTPRMRDWYLDCVQEVGLERRFAGFRAPARRFERIGSVQADLREALLECIEACHRQDGADVVITAGAPLTGFADSVQGTAGPLLVDPVVAAVQQAVAIATLRARDPGAQGRRCAPKASDGLAPALAARFAQAEVPCAFPPPLRSASANRPPQ